MREYIFNEKVDIVGLQETVKHDFADHELCEQAGVLTLPGFGWLLKANPEASFLELRLTP